MKMLFCCTTEFQLLTALNVKYHMHPDDDADIIVSNYHGEEKELAERVRKTRMFRKVFFVKEYIENSILRQYLLGLSDGTPGTGLVSSIRNTFLFAKMKATQLFCGARAYIETMLDNASSLDVTEYDLFLAHGQKTVTTYLAEYIFQSNKHCRFCILDEGIGTYMATSIGEFVDNIDTYYAYAPDLMLYERKIRQIPKLKKTDKAFIAILNDVFGFSPSDVEDYRDSVIIFSQNGSEEKMPKYLKWIPVLSKIFLRNAYLRHMKEEKEYYEQLQIMDFAIRKAIQNKDGYRVWLKLNPRASRDQIEEYSARKDIRLLRRWDLPWELLALNCPLGNNIFLTNATSAVCMQDDVVEDIPRKVFRVLLYKLLKEEMPDESLCFFAMLEKRRENIYVPEKINDLDFI